MVSDLTFEKLESTVKDFFKDHFDYMHFKRSELPVLPVLVSEAGEPRIKFVGVKGGYQFGYTFYLMKWAALFAEGREYHMLESLKGDIERVYNKIELDKPLT